MHDLPRSVREAREVPAAANTVPFTRGDESTIDGSSWTRLGGGVGLLSILLLLVAVATGPGKLISANSSAAQVIDSLGSQTNRAVGASAIAVLSLTLFIWYVASLAHTLHARDRGAPFGLVVLGAGIATSVLGSLDNVIYSLLVFLAKHGGLAREPALTRMLYHLYNGLLMPGMVAFTIAVYLTGIGLAALRNTIGRRWLGWLSLTLVPLSLLSGFVGLTVSDGGTSPVAPIGVLGFALITMITSTFMLRDAPRATDPSEHR